MKNKKIESRYLSIRNEGQEIYVENIGTAGDISSLIYTNEAKYRLGLIQKAMPQGDWAIFIEELLPREFNEKRVYRTFDPISGKKELN